MGRTGQTLLIGAANVIGIGRSYVSIITSALFVLILIFYAYSAGSYLKVIIYPFQNRVIYYKSFDSYVFNQFIDHLIIISAITVWLGFSLQKTKVIIPVTYSGLMVIMTLRYSAFLDIAVLMSVPAIILLTIYNRFAHQNKRKVLNNETNTLLLNYFALAGTVIGIIGVIISVAPLFSISPSLIHIRNYEYDLFLLLSSVSSILLLLLLGCVPVKIFIKAFTTAVLRVTPKDTTTHSVAFYSDNNNSISLKSKIIYLSSFMLLSVVIALIPHQSQINPANRQIGVDTDYYVKWINALAHAVDYKEFIHQAFAIQSFGNEPFTLLFFFSIVKIVYSFSLFSIIEYVPIILCPSLVLVVFFLTRELTASDRQALFASFLTSLSFQVLIGVYAGFYANWFALIIGYLSILFLLRSLRHSNYKLNLAIFFTLLIALLFAHIHTWSVLVVIMSIFLMIMIKVEPRRRKRIVLLVLVLSSSVVLDVVKTSLTGSLTGIQKDIEFAKATGVGLGQFSSRWSNLIRSVYSFVGGQFSNFIIFSLGIYWLFQANTRDISSILLMIFLSVGLIAFLIGDYRFQTRIFYDIPFQLPAAIALSSIRRYQAGTLVPIPICIWMIGLTIRDLINFPSAL